MKLLAIESATTACSVALWLDGELHERHEIAPRRHAEWLLPWCDELLAAAAIDRNQLDAVAFGSGPGAFTGLRIACSIAQGVAFALDLPVVAVSTLEALALTAYQADGGERWLTAIDARMGEIYWAGWSVGSDGATRCLIEEQLGDAQSVDLPVSGEWRGCGSGWQAAGEPLANRCGPLIHSTLPGLAPRAAMVAEIAARRLAAGELGEVDGLALPHYLRDRVVA
jgi:tRNA threonylcarbamoyladenosine biosynthesis protein TsaB